MIGRASLALLLARLITPRCPPPIDAAPPSSTQARSGHPPGEYNELVGWIISFWGPRSRIRSPPSAGKTPRMVESGVGEGFVLFFFCSLIGETGCCCCCCRCS